MRTGSLGMTVADAGEECLVTCNGGLDASSAGGFLDALDAVVALHPERIYLDFSAITSIDSSGIGAVMHVALACRAKGIVLSARMTDAMRLALDPLGASALISLEP